MSQPSSPLIPFALELFDAVTVIADGGWQRVRLELDASRGHPRVARVVAELGPDGAQPKPELGVEPGSFIGVINEVLPELQHALEHQRVRWDAHALIVEKAAPGARIRLVDASGADAHAIRLSAKALGHLVFSDPLLALLKESDDSLAPKQEAFIADALGFDAWRYEEPLATLHLVKGSLPWRQYKAQALGTWSEQQDAFVWAWADPAIDDGAKAGIRAVRAQAERTPGLGALLRPSMPGDLRFAWTLCRAAAVKLGARALFRGENSRGILFLAIVD